MRRGDREFADLSSNNAGKFDAYAYYHSGPHLLLADKATEQLNYTNPEYEGRAKAMHAVGGCVVSYLYARVTVGSPEKQVDRFVEAISAVHDPHRDRIAVDMEFDGSSGNPREDVIFAAAMWARLAKVGHPRGILYGPMAYLMECGPGILNPYSADCWVANYLGPDSTPARTVAVTRAPGRGRVWAVQHTDGNQGAFPHNTPGVPGNCDMSTLNRLTWLKLIAGRGL